MSIYNIITDQNQPHPDLEKVVTRHLQHPYQRPIAKHTQQQYDAMKTLLENNNIILDSGCGTGLSSYHLSQQFPDYLIIGVDKSTARLSRQRHRAENMFLVQAELIDFWRLLVADNIPIYKHFLLYPNPWPKAKRLNQRFHGHPIFPTLLQVANDLTVRSNWLLYLQEFQQAAKLCGYHNSHITPLAIQQPMTLFETKYWQNNIACFELSISRNI